MISRSSKYGNRKVQYKGMTFDSTAEYNRYRELELLLAAGVISDLKCQVPFEIIPKQNGERKADYIVDFTYAENGRKVAEDVKGHTTDVYILKRKLFKLRYPDWEFREIKTR